MIYLDSAATSLLKPAAVPRAVSRAIRTLASPGRGGHAPAMVSAISSACSPLSGWEIYSSSMSTPIFFA